MSLIISAEEAGRVVMGADSAGGTPDEVYTFPDLEKIVQRGPYLVGACGDGRVCQIIRTLVDWPDLPEVGDLGELQTFLIREVAPVVRETVEKAGALHDGRAKLGNKTQVVLGVKGQIFSLTTDLAVVKTTPVTCIGAGRHHGYAAMHALAAAGVDTARKRIEMALEAAAEHSLYVRPPFRFLESDG
jgi:hypothetical protein